MHSRSDIKMNTDIDQFQIEIATKSFGQRAKASSVDSKSFTTDPIRKRYLI